MLLTDKPMALKDDHEQLSAIQLKVEKSDSSDFKSTQRRTEIVFVVKLQTSQKISHLKINFGELNW